MTTLMIDVSKLTGRYAEVVARAKQGDEVIITAAGQPSVRLIPVPEPATKPRILGLHAGAAVVAPDFNDPLPPEVWSDEPK